MIQGLAECGVIEWCFFDVETDIGNREIRRHFDEVFVDLFGVILHTRKVGKADACRIDFVVFVHRHCDTAGKVEDDFVEVCHTVPVIFVSCKPDPLADSVFFQPERAGAYRVVCPVLTERFDIIVVEHERGRIGQLGNKVCLWGVDRQSEGPLIDYLDARRRGGISIHNVLNTYDIPEELFGNCRCGVRVGCTLERPFEVLCGDGVTVGEFQVVSEFELINRATV